MARNFHIGVSIKVGLFGVPSHRGLGDEAVKKNRRRSLSEVLQDVFESGELTLISYVFIV